MLKIVIVDDEKEQSDLIAAKTKEFLTEKQIESEITTYNDAQLFWKEFTPYRYDLLFLDIDMSPVNGMALAAQIRKKDGKATIVFITNLARFALKGYEVQAFDFIVKPLTENVFRHKMNRIAEFCVSNQKKSICIRTGSETVYIDESEIYYIECTNHYLIYHTEKGNFSEWSTLKKVLKNLSEHRFALCNRGYLVNLEYIQILKQNSVVVHGDELLISRPKKKEFFEAVAGYVRR